MEDPSSKPDHSKQKRASAQRGRLFKSAVSLLIIAGILFFMLRMVSMPMAKGESALPTFTYALFKEQVRLGNVEKIRTSGDQIDVWLKEPLQGATGSSPAAPQGTRASASGEQPAGQSADLTYFKFIRPSIDDPSLMPLLEKHGVEVESAAPPSGSSWGGVAYLLVMLTLIPLGFFPAHAVLRTAAK